MTEEDFKGGIHAAMGAMLTVEREVSLEPTVTRRAFLLAPFLLTSKAEAAGLHVTGRLTATDQEAQEGYFALCSATGVCHPTDSLVITAHPKNPEYPHLRALVNRDVQVSIFSIPI